MSETEPTQVSTGTPGDSSSNRSGAGRGRNGNRRNARIPTKKYKGKIETVLTLAAKSERSGYGYASFIKSLYEYCLANLKSPQDLAPVLLHRKDPMQTIGSALPSLRSVAATFGMTLEDVDEDDTAATRKSKERKNDEIKEMIEPILAAERSEFVKRKNLLESNMPKLWGLTIGQCTPALYEHLKSQEGFGESHRKYDCVWLLETLQLLAAGTDAASNPFVSAYLALRQLHRLKQFPEETLEEYLARFEEYVDQVRLNKLKVFEFGETPADLGELTEKEAEERFLAVVLLKGADPIRYKSLWTSLENDMSLSVDKYPTTISRAMNLLTTWKDPTMKKVGPGGPRGGEGADRRDGVTFAQVARSGGTTPGIDGVTHTEVKCYNCNGFGHYANSCPRRDSHVQGAHVTLAQSKLLQSGDLLLDNQSSISICCDKDLVADLKRDPRGVHVITNGGSINADYYGTSTILPKLTNVWYNEYSITNILSLSEVQKHYRVTMDSESDDGFVVHVDGGKKLKFKEREGLYVLSRPKVSPNHNYCLLHDTVEQRRERYTRDELGRADEAAELIRNIGYVNPDRLMFMLSNGLIENCHLNTADVRRAKDIFGEFVDTRQGKSVRRTARKIPTITPEPVPRTIYEEFKYVTLCIDHFFVNGLSFFHSVSQGLKFRTSEGVENLSNRTTLECLISIVRVYNMNNFVVTQINGDMAFEGLRRDLMPVRLVTAPAGEKVPEVEVSIKVIKERLRCITSGLPFKRITKAMTKAFAYEVGRNLNDVPPREGASRIHSPARIVANRPRINYENLKVRPGQYCLVLDDHQPWNNLVPRKIGAIALRQKEDGNGWYFLSLNTWRQVSCGLINVDVLPFTEEVVAAVEARARQEGMPELRDGEMILRWRDGAMVQRLNDAELMELEGEPAGERPHVGDLERANVVQHPLALEDRQLMARGRDALVAENNDEQVENDDNDEIYEEEFEEINEDNEENMNDEHTENKQTEEDIEAEVNEEHAEVEIRDQVTIDKVQENEEIEKTGENKDIHQRDTEDEQVETEEHNEATEGDGRPEERRYPLRDRKRKELLNLFQSHSEVCFPSTKDLERPSRSANGGFRHGALCFFMKHEDREKVEDRLSLADKYRTIVRIIMEDEELRKEHVCFTQMPAKKGIAVFGKRAIEAIFKEFKQLHDKDVFKPIDPTKLTAQQKRDALREITIIKEKRCGKIKGRTCADGRPQRKYVSKEDSSSPTVSNDAFLMSLIIDALEERDVATADVEGAYLHADMEDFTIMKITSEDHINILCDVDDEYRKFIEIDEKTGKKTLYVQLAKALYGCIKSALLWYRLFSETLIGMGFELNPVDKCVANKMVEGKQCTVSWYVDDNKISHKNPSVVTEVIEKIEERFGKMSVTRGKTHTFLGMDITFKDKKVEIDMKSYCEQAIDDFHRKVYTKAATPAKRDIFEIDEDSPLLSEEDRENFHSVTALLLYVALRGRPDIMLPVSFLCTRVGKASMQDDEKLLRVLKYLKVTLDLKYTLGADTLKSLKVWVDAAFAVHLDMKGHTGGAMSLGTGTFMNKSSKQKLNVLSSTECELVGASSYLQHAIWMCQFLEHQGYLPDEKILYQDNESAIRFAKNGGASARKNSKHIDVRYFFIKDRLEKGGYVVEHCRTTKMIADFFTKPLQGKLFRVLRDVIMGRTHISSLDLIDETNDDDLSSSNEERVGQRLSQVAFADNIVNHDSVEVANMRHVDRGKHVDRGNTKEEIEESNHSFDLTQSVI